MRRFILLSGLLTIAGALVACQIKQTSLIQAHAPGQPPAGMTAVEATGGVTLTIRWPERSVQFIPSTATKIVFGVYPEVGMTAIATTSATRPNGAATSSVTFSALPTGVLRFTADALDPDGYIGASGSATISVQPNALTKGALTMRTTANPTIATFLPANGVPGQQVTITGTGFLHSRDASYSIRYGNALLSEASTFRLSDTSMGFFVPAGAQNATFSVTVGGVTATSLTKFRAIATLSVVPQTATLDATTTSVQLTVAATDSEGVAIPSPSVSWVKLGQDCADCGTSLFLASLDANGLVTRSDSGKTGSMTVGAGVAPLLATASLTVN